MCCDVTEGDWSRCIADGVASKGLWKVAVGLRAGSGDGFSCLNIQSKSIPSKGAGANTGDRRCVSGGLIQYEGHDALESHREELLVLRLGTYLQKNP